MKPYSTVRPQSPWVVRAFRRLIEWFEKIPESLIAALGRFSIAAVFWKSGQTKIEGFALDIVDGTLELGWPSISATTYFLFREEYRLPFMSAEIAAPLTAFAEHLFPTLILIGLLTRFSAAALLVMTLVIQIFVYPGAYPTHGVWATVLLYLMVRGGGFLSIDHLIAHRLKRAG